MALPALEKTWLHWVNQTFLEASLILTQEATILAVKDRFKTIPGCTVISSSNASAVSLVGGDLWTTGSDLVFHTTVRSWILLQFANIGNMQMLLDCDYQYANKSSVEFKISRTGFTGGGIGTPPTATDQRTVINNNSAGYFLSNSLVINRIHILHSDDGEQVRFIYTHSNEVRTYMLFGKVADPAAGWADPVFMFAHDNSYSQRMTYQFLFDSSSYGFGWHGAVNMALSMSCEGSGNDALGENLTLGNEVSGEWPMAPIGVFCNTTGAKGRHGRIPDLWFGSTGAASADTYPDDGSRQFAQFNHIIVPWNGTVLVI